MVTEEQTGGVGFYLREYRRSKDISLQVVSQQTKIRTVVLRQIESDDFKQMPPPAFSKGFIRAYAEAVGADVQEALQRYETARRHHSHIEQPEPPPEQTPTAFWKRLLPVLILFAVLVTTTVYIANRMRVDVQPPAAGDDETVETIAPAMSEDGPKETAPAAAPGEPVTVPSEPEETPGPGGAAIPATTGQEAAPVAQADASEERAGPADISIPATPGQEGRAVQTDTLNDSPAATAVGPSSGSSTGSSKWVLQLRAVETTWLKIVRDDAPAREMTLHPEDEVTFEAQQQFDLLIGNAGGIRLKLNDKPVPISGRSGKVLRMRLP